MPFIIGKETYDTIEEFSAALDREWAATPRHIKLRWYLARRTSKVRQIPRQVKWFWQRGRRGYADCDVWSFDHYLLSFLPEALRALRNELHGHPTELTPLEWRMILTRMADGFDRARARDGLLLSEKKESYQEALTDWDETCALFGKWFFHLWD